MTSQNLFKDNNGNWLSNELLYKKLKELDAHDCDVLFVHTALNFGTPNMAIKKKELLALLLEVLRNLNVGTLCMPTYTFSFCNGKEYDPKNSKSKMGALNEYFRQQEGVIRSLDPLMSIALEGEKQYLATEVGTHSIGEGSTFDLLHNTDRVKFLFMGPQIGDCFTYVHYLEWLYDLDYRYPRYFRGEIIEKDKSSIVEQDLFVRYKGVIPNKNLFNYGLELEKKGVAKSSSFGEGNLTVVEKVGAEKEYLDFILKDPHYFVDVHLPYHDKTFELTEEMVAL